MGQVFKKHIKINDENKLFLCSRNIEVGDEFIYEDNPGDSNKTYYKGKCVSKIGNHYVGENGFLYMSLYCYTIILELH